MMQDKVQFMKMAVQLACESLQKGNGGPFGAVVVKDGQVIGSSANQVTINNDPTAHAEIMAIRQACAHLQVFQLTGCEIYASCEPCPMCLGAIYWARPDKVYFAGSKEAAAKVGFDDAFIYEELDKPREQRSIPFEQLSVEDEALPFQYWQEKEDRTEY